VEWRQTYQKLIVPDGTLGKWLDPGIQEASLGKNVCVGGGQPKQSPARPTVCSQKGSSRDPAAIEETVLKVLPTRARCEKAEPDG
jgi:hypothetical protein